LTAVAVLFAIVVIGGVSLVSRSGDGVAATGENLVPPGAHALSKAEDGKVSLVEFLDFQCPACASYYTDITKELEQDYRGRITFVTRHFPLGTHPLADPAARAAEAAGKQGKYAEMYRALYDNFDQWAAQGQATSADSRRANAEFEEYAADAGLDLRKFRTDLTSPAVRSAIDRDIAAAKEAGVTGAPTFFLNGEKFEPFGTTIAAVDRELRAAIDAALAG
jgi:protein-disulfide isomerase